jgi:sugar/nucleoside kinase (ribokinase family)
MWATQPPDGFEDLLAATDLLFVNRLELAALAGQAAPDAERAAGVLRRMRADGALIIVKRVDGSTGFSKLGEIAREDHTVLSPSSIVNATGPGDVFAAGFLAGLISSSTVDQSLARGAALALRSLG